MRRNAFPALISVFGMTIIAAVLVWPFLVVILLVRTMAEALEVVGGFF